MGKPNIIMIFGVFDILHEGHVQFFKQIADMIKDYEKNEIIVVVTRDSIVYQLKKRYPIENETERATKIKTHINFLPNMRVVLGDEVLSTYAVLKENSPNIICLGYDQSGLKNNLEQEMLANHIPTIPIVMMGPYKPDIYHSSIIRAGLKQNCH